MATRTTFHPKALPRRPQGQETRGKTTRNRLRRVDNFVCLYAPALVQRTTGVFTNAFFVDLGYGAEPFTTLESADRLRRLNPHLPVLGVEIDAERVATAQPFADDLTHFRLGGFNIPLQAGERVRLVRAFNVLRQYEVQAVSAAYAMIAHALLPGGILIEGTSDPFGRIWVAHVLRKMGTAPLLHHEALVFSTSFRTGFDPTEFQTILPKNLIHQVVPGTPIYQFFADWKQATVASVAQRTWGLRPWFTASAQRLCELGYRIDVRRRWLGRGYLVWQQPLLFK